MIFKYYFGWPVSIFLGILGGLVVYMIYTEPPLIHCTYEIRSIHTNALVEIETVASRECNAGHINYRKGVRTIFIRSSK